MKDIFKWLGPLLGLVIYFICISKGLGFDASATAGITSLCALWWSTEAVPIPVTSMVPFVLFPMSGILGSNELAQAMGNKFILLFMGGFMLSRAAEKSSAHLRIGHGMIKLVGTHSNRRLIIGFMLATAFCSMWISNTATALIMLPVALAVIEESEADERFAVCLLLAIAYGASIGGIATLIGTPPNGVLAATYEKVGGRTIDFLSWMKIGAPISIIMLVVCAVVLTWHVRGRSSYHAKNLGPWTAAQRRVLGVLSATALLWITRILPFGWGGWSVWLDMPKANDATVALLATVVLFLVPNGLRTAKGEKDHLLDWDTARDIPWGILLLFAGGLVIAKGFGVSGLAEDIGLALKTATGGLHPLVVMLVICFTVTFMTELTSNTATTTLLMPILGASAIASGVDPALYMVPAALSASCAFMLPVATPPNAIILGGSDLITIPKMARYGLVLNLVGVVVISLLCYFLLDSQYGLIPPSSP